MLKIQTFLEAINNHRITENILHLGGGGGGGRGLKKPHISRENKSVDIRLVHTTVKQIKSTTSQGARDESKAKVGGRRVFWQIAYRALNNWAFILMQATALAVTREEKLPRCKKICGSYFI